MSIYDGNFLCEYAQWPTIVATKTVWVPYIQATKNIETFKVKLYCGVNHCGCYKSYIQLVKKDQNINKKIKIKYINSLKIE